MSSGDYIILSGRSNLPLAEIIVQALGRDLNKIKVYNAADGEVLVQILDNVRERQTFLIQSTCRNPLTNCDQAQHLMELLTIVDAAKRASASQIIAVMPYFGYARQDRKTKGREPITAKLVANLMERAGVNRLITMDIHAGQIQGFFDDPVDNLSFLPVVIGEIRKIAKQGKIVLVSPDAGGVERVRAYAKILKAPIAIIDKRRDAPNVSKSYNIIGTVKGKIAVTIDDLVDTAGTLAGGAEALIKKGATEVYAICTHPLFSRDAVDKITKSPIERMIVSDSIPLSEKAQQCEKIEVISLKKILAEAIRRTHNRESLSQLFDVE